MTQRRLLEVSITVLGIYTLVTGIETLSAELKYFRPWPLTFRTAFSTSVQLLPALASFLIAWALLRYTRKIASLFFSDEEESFETAAALAKDEWYTVVLTTTGVLLLVWVVLPVLVHLPLYFFPPELKLKTEFEFLRTPAEWWNLWVLTVQLIYAGIGFYLIIRGREVARLIVRLQAG